MPFINGYQRYKWQFFQANMFNKKLSQNKALSAREQYSVLNIS